MNATKIKLKALVLSGYMMAMLETETPVPAGMLDTLMDFDDELAEAEAQGLLEGDIVTDIYELLNALENFEG